MTSTDPKSTIAGLTVGLTAEPVEKPTSGSSPSTTQSHGGAHGGAHGAAHGAAHGGRNSESRSNPTGLTRVELERPDVSSFTPRQRILAAALKLFVEQGYFNTNVPDLSRVSKCSVGSIYHTFKNKEEVATALYDEGIRAFRKALEESINPKDDVSDQVRTVVRSFLGFSEMNHQLSKYIWLCRHNEFMSGIIKHPTMVGFDRLGRTLTKTFKQGIRDGKIRKLRANLLWSAVFGIPLAYVRDWLDGYNSVPPSKVADELSDACWRAVKAEQGS